MLNSLMKGKRNKRREWNEKKKNKNKMGQTIDLKKGINLR
jgi:hypothetical protein